ncbi:MAG: patatin-like phospholipase family protein [Pseudomonadota bacterium]
MSDAPARRALLGAALGLSATACSIPPRLDAVPRGRGVNATVLGLPNERFRPEAGVAPYEREAAAAGIRRHAHLGLAADAPLPPINMLAISGGGEDGAFGAGLLCGWTQQGTRPEFDLVTGVSTGALTAPFAFLGPAYDDALKEVYTDITIADVAIRRSIFAAIFDDALTDTLPLLNTVSRYMDATMLAAIATSYGQGRMLLIGTTDLDAQLPIVWNIGAIASSGHPGALQLVRRLLVASAAIPGAFPPVMIDVEADGVRHQEMHVDGGAGNQAFLYPAALTRRRREAIRRGREVRPGSVYVIRNARLDADWAPVQRRTVSIAGRAISTMIASSGFNDTFRIWANAERDGLAFRLAFIGRDFETEYTTPFHQPYMRALFDNGFARARGGFPWASAPPSVDQVPVLAPAVPRARG